MYICNLVYLQVWVCKTVYVFLSLESLVIFDLKPIIVPNDQINSSIKKSLLIMPYGKIFLLKTVFEFVFLNA